MRMQRKSDPQSVGVINDDSSNRNSYDLAENPADISPAQHGYARPPDEYEVSYYEISNAFIAVCCIILVGLAVLCGTLTSSFHYVRYDEYALLQNRYGTIQLDKVYGEGRYAFTLNYDMIKFPSNYIPVDISAVVFTETGLEFEVSVNFMYRLPKQNIGKIYNSFSNNYDDLVKSNAKTTIKNTAANLKFDLYFSNRTYVQNLFATEVAHVLLDIVNVEVPIDFFRIGNVVLPESIIELSLESEIALQQNDLLANSQRVAVIRAETGTLVASITAKTDQTLNFAQNKAKRIIESSNSYGNQIEIRSRALGITSLLNTLDFANIANYSNSIIKALAMLDNADNTTIVSAEGIQLQIT